MIKVYNYCIIWALTTTKQNWYANLPNSVTLMLVSKVAKLQREKSSEVLPAGCAGHFTKRRSKPVSAMTRPDNSMNNLWIHFAAGFRHKVSVIAARIRELQRMNPAHSATRSRVEICSQEGWGKAVEWQTYRQLKQTSYCDRARRLNQQDSNEYNTRPAMLDNRPQCITGRCRCFMKLADG